MAMCVTLPDDFALRLTGATFHQIGSDALFLGCGPAGFGLFAQPSRAFAREPLEPSMPRISFRNDAEPHVLRKLPPSDFWLFGIPVLQNPATRSNVGRET